jgi:hypothetical protein
VALLFNGSTSLIQQTNSNLLEGIAFSLCFRWKLTTSTISDIVLDQFTSLTGGCRVNIAGGSNTTFQFSIGLPAGNIACTIASSVTTGVWQHWFIAYDGGQATSATRLKIWKDGVAQTVSFTATVPATIAASGANFYVGDPAGAASFDGSIADLMYWLGSGIPSGLPESQWLSYKPLHDDGSGFNLGLWCPYDDGISAMDYTGSATGSGVAGGPISVTATKSPDSPGISLGHPEMIIE